MPGQYGGDSPDEQGAIYGILLGGSVFGDVTLPHMQLQQVLPGVQAILQPEMERFFAEYRQRAENIDYWSVDVLDRIQEYCQRPGKGVRPALVAVGAALAQGVTLEEAWQQPAVKVAMLMVQLKHKRLLMMDDVSDQDEMRNGRPAFHVLWEQDLAAIPQYQHLSQAKRTHVARSYTEVAGLWLDSMSFWLLKDPAFTAEQRLALLEIMQEHVYDKTSTGWYVIFDQSFEPLSDETSEERLLRGLELVSGEYTFVNPLRAGAALGATTQPSAELETALRQYGQAAGILFQITDDIIGAFGDPKVTGKPVGGDFREGKKTLLVQHAWRQGSQKQREFLRETIGKESLSQDEVKQIQAIMQLTGARAYAQEKAQAYAESAATALEKLPGSEEKQFLLGLLQYILQREK